MAAKTLNTRIKVRYGTYSEWDAVKSTAKLLKGEIAIVEIPASTGEIASEPAYIIKVGTTDENGGTAFEDLPYISAIAGDVYSWAKKSRGAAADIDIVDAGGNYTLKTGETTKNLEIIIADLYSKLSSVDGAPTTISNPVSATASNTNTIDVVSAIQQDQSNTHQLNLTKETIYTKKRIDELLNPTMEFKGVQDADQLDLITLDNSMVGDCYKISEDGILGLTNATLRGAKVGDLAIVIKISGTDPDPDTYDWAIIPAGNENFTDTWRSIKYKTSGNDASTTTLVGNGINTKDIEFIADDGVTLTGNTSGTNATLTIGIGPIAEHIGYGSVTDQLLVNNTQTTVKGYVDASIAALDATVSAGTETGTNKQKVLTSLTETNGVISGSGTVLSINDLDVGDYLIINGGSAGTYN